MRTSKLADSIADSPTLKLNAEAKKLKEKGKPIIHFGSGEPFSKIPQEAINAGEKVIKSGEVRYTAVDGTIELKKAIGNYMEINYGRKPAPENIIVSNGAKNSLATFFCAVIDPQDEVIVTAPYWVSYPDLVKLAYGVPVIVDYRGKFEPDISDIAKAITPKTKAIVVNSPNNPSGAAYTEKFVSDMVALCERKGVYLIMDDIYHQLMFDGKSFHSAYRHTKKDINDSMIVIINGVSKLYAMTGFRIGWAVANRDIVAAMKKIQAQTTSCPGTISQAAAAAALEGNQSCVENLRSVLQKNRDVMMRELAKITGVKARKPEGTFYCLPDFSTYETSSEKLSRFLLEKALVVTVPGKEFGVEGHLRLSYCGNSEEITEGIARIKWALDPDSPKELFMGGVKVTRDW